MNHVELAKEASQKAYCPYSKFRVGAVVVTAIGNTYTGCNYENYVPSRTPSEMLSSKKVQRCE